MKSSSLRIAAAALIAVAGASAVWAQQPQTMRVRGAIEKVDGNMVVVKASDGADVTLTLAAIKPGFFIGSAAMPQPDGSQKALEVHIFPEAMRGTGEGHRPYTVPNSTMTNGTVGDMVTASDGQSLTVKYKDGEKTIVVPPGVPIVRYEITDRSALKPGAHVTTLNAVKKPDGTIEAPRLNVGRDGVVPR
jgi:hypothetical protein